MKLYEYPQALDKLVRLALEEGDLSEELMTEASQLGVGFKAKVSNCAKLIQELKSQSVALKSEADRLSGKRSSVERKIDWLKDYVTRSMLEMDMDSVKDDVFTVTVSDTSGRVTIVDQEQIPTRYLEMDVKVLKSEILTSLKEGEIVPGCQLEKSKSLRIR
tara:strand:- start:61 stop:543 length:483 start_codon:yes stop_codon:yes gene_type:complete